MRGLPKEHGLTVSWIDVFALSLLTTHYFHIYGFILFVVAVPSLFLYDRVISGLRMMNVGKLTTRDFVSKKIGASGGSVVLTISTVAIILLVLGRLPLISAVIPIVFFISYFVAFRFLGERNSFSRNLSVLAITSQYLPLNSALSGSLNTMEVFNFIIISLINIILVTGVEQIVMSKIFKKSLRKSFTRIGLPVLVISLVILAVISSNNYLQLLVFYAIMIFSTVSIFLVRHRSMKVVGIVSSFWNVFTTVLLIINFYAIGFTIFL